MALPSRDPVKAGPEAIGEQCGRGARTVAVGGTFDQPIFATAPRGDARLFAVERPGTIRVLDANRSRLATPFLDITAKRPAAAAGLALSNR